MSLSHLFVLLSHLFVLMLHLFVLMSRLIYYSLLHIAGTSHHLFFISYLFQVHFRYLFIQCKFFFINKKLFFLWSTFKIYYTQFIPPKVDNIENKIATGIPSKWNKNIISSRCFRITAVNSHSSHPIHSSATADQSQFMHCNKKYSLYFCIHNPN